MAESYRVGLHDNGVSISNMLLKLVSLATGASRVEMRYSPQHMRPSIWAALPDGSKLDLEPWSKPADALVLLRAVHGMLSFSPSGVVSVSSSIHGRSVFVRLSQVDLNRAYPSLRLDPVCVGVLSLLMELDHARKDPAAWVDKRDIAGLYVCATLQVGVSYA